MRKAGVVTGFALSAWATWDVVVTTAKAAGNNFERIDTYFAADEPETEIQYRRSLLGLLADLRPQLAELLVGPRESQ